jgi:exopolysaccharide biosynthesis predicted pyruvyltransferase EpsI
MIAKIKKNFIYKFLKKIYYNLKKFYFSYITNNRLDFLLNNTNIATVINQISDKYMLPITKHPKIDVINEKKIENVITELKKFDKFLFSPNSGNLGDSIIAQSEFQVFSLLKLEYEILDLYSEKKGNGQFNYSNYVYGGGGLFNELYEFDNVIEAFKNKQYKRIIILPSSFFKCDTLLKIFDERFVIFCREEQSYNYCISMNNRAKFVLSHDMAFNLDLSSYILDYSIIFTAIKNFDRTYSGYLYNSYRFVTKIMNKIYIAINKKVIPLENEQKLGVVMRTDDESDISQNNSCFYNSFDLSSFGHYSNVNPRIVYVLSLLFIHTLNYFDIIITDRLHVGISSAIMGKKVYLLDNNYGKLSMVYKQSMYNFQNVRIFKSISDIETEVAVKFPVVNTEVPKNMSNFKMTFDDFLIIYFSPSYEVNISNG